MLTEQDNLLIVLPTELIKCIQGRCHMIRPNMHKRIVNNHCQFDSCVSLVGNHCHGQAQVDMILAGTIKPCKIVDASHAITNLQIKLRQWVVIVAVVMRKKDLCQIALRHLIQQLASLN